MSVRVGEITRGMLVVDRREGDETLDASASYRALQTALETQFSQLTTSGKSHVIPAQVEVETPPKEPQHPLGVPVVVQTPGPAVILRLLAQRVWGVTVP